MLEDNEIYNSTVTVDVAQIGDEIVINSVKVSVIDEYSVDEVKDILFKNLGIVADVKRIGE